MGKNRAWIYCRTAHEDAAAMGWQRKQLEEYAGVHGMDVIGITEKHESGRTLRRSGIGELNRALEKNPVDTLLVKGTDRIARSPIQAAEYLGWLEKKGIRVECMDSASEDYKLLRQAWEGIRL